MIDLGNKAESFPKWTILLLLFARQSPKIIYYLELRAAKFE